MGERKRRIARKRKDRPSELAQSWHPRRYGPFLVNKKLSPVTYRLKLPTMMKIHPVFHADLLTRYRETDKHSPNYEKPPPKIIDGEPEWEVEKIINSRLHGRYKRLQFLVRWKGFPPSEDSWVPELDLSALDLLKDFYATHPRAPRELLSRRPRQRIKERR